MKPKSKVAIFSSFALDVLIDKSGNIIDKREGGPALFLQNAFIDCDVPFDFYSGSKIKVEILMTDNGEFGKVPNKPNITKVNLSQLDYPFVLVSTILDEFDLSQAGNFFGKIFLDVQGYVRDGNDFGKKKQWQPTEEIRDKIFCLKGTSEEIKNISKEWLEKQKKNKILLITRGEDGCELFAHGDRYIIKPKFVVNAKDTIGAGDTFFAYFVCYFIKTYDAESSVKFATEKVIDFLSNK